MTIFSNSDDDAGSRYLAYKSLDPFPDIPPALLNSADIYDYVAKTGMLFPFESSKGKLKSASYEIDFLGEVYSWDEEGKERHRVIDLGTEFNLEKNSIAFLHLRTFFRLPDYIALRFNFKIRHVHRGLLLGTGPLVDPGYVGRLLVPLHNLTSDKYVLKGGDGLLWVEFTKVSPNRRWDPTSGRHSTNYYPFPDIKNTLTASDFFKKASGGAPIRSSIPDEVREATAQSAIATNKANEAANFAALSERAARRMRRQFQTVGVISIAALIISLITASWQIGKLLLDTNVYLHQAKEELNETKKLLPKSTIDSDLTQTKERVNALEKQMRLILEAKPKASIKSPPFKQNDEALDKPTKK
jgi:deoxycytidine triphosphate deaminase